MLCECESCKANARKANACMCKSCANYKPKPISEIQLNRIKDEIIVYLNTHHSAYISELVSTLGVEPKKIVYAIRELKDEGLLV